MVMRMDDIQSDPSIITHRVSDRPLTLLPDPGPREVWCPVISVDDHALEPKSLFDRVPAQYRDLAPKMLESEGAGAIWQIEDKQRSVSGTDGAVGRPWAEVTARPSRLEEFRRGVWDVDARVRDMDLNGVWASLNFPSSAWGFAGTALSTIRDPAAAFACVQAYNDWVVEEWCGRYPDRFIPCQLPFLADPTLAASTDGATPLSAVLQTQWAPKSRYPQPRAHDLQKAEYREVMGALLEAGADTDVQLKTHLWYWEYGRNRIGLDIKGATPFWRATIAQDVEAMRLLVAYGADPNIPTSLPPVNMREGRQQDGRLQDDSGLPSVTENQPGYYPIHVAAGGGYVGLGAHSIQHVPDGFMSTVKYLVEEHGADVNIADFWGYTPVHYAAIRGDNELILYLVSQGADVTTKTRLGQTTADMARGGRGGYFQRVEFSETVELLQSLGSELACLHTHFVGTGDVCEGAGAVDSWTPAVTDDATDETTRPR